VQCSTSRIRAISITFIPKPAGSDYIRFDTDREYDGQGGAEIPHTDMISLACDAPRDNDNQCMISCSSVIVFKLIYDNIWELERL